MSTRSTKGWATMAAVAVGGAGIVATVGALGSAVIGEGVAAAGVAHAVSPTLSRLAGPDRFGTAAAIAQATFPQGATDAVIASGAAFPDALSASYLAGRLTSPVLLTFADSVPSETLSALSALGVQTISIIGGPAAVSANVQSALEAAGYRVRRLAGADRFATAATVAEAFSSATVGSLGSGGSTAIVASGVNFADALAGSPLSFAGAFPTLLTDPASLSSATASALSTLGIKQVLLLGGTSAVSGAVASSISGMGIAVTRVGGADRTQTASMIADLELTQLGWSGAHANLARGDGFADALGGGPHAGVEKEPILVTESPDSLGPFTTMWLQQNSSTLTSLHVFGGTAAVSAATAAAAQQAG
jgi:putative cell wall-binding protein